MKSKKTSQQQILAACDAIGIDDGLDPRTVHRKPTGRRTNRKALQLCGQIAQTLNSVLAWESGDDVLQSLFIESVEPAPNSTRVLVTVRPQSAEFALDASQILERLHRFAGKLRIEVAAAIHRKKVPELVFRVMLPDAP